MRCSDDNYYVVKFQNNPQGNRILANELLAGQLAKALGLPVAEGAIVNVKKILVDLTPDMAIELEKGGLPCQPGTCFGSLYSSPHALPGQGGLSETYDFVPDEYLSKIENLQDFLGMLVFDTWTGNTDGRQVIFVRCGGDAGFRAVMIDQGFCFNGSHWNFPDLLRLALYPKRNVYLCVHGIESFEPWLERLNTRINEGLLRGIADSLPTEWYGHESDNLDHLLSRLDRRRKTVPDLLCSTWKSYRFSFPNWNSRVAVGAAF